MNFIARGRKSTGDEFRVIADASWLRRILARDEMPVRQRH
jgi:hypothetical protein